MALSIKNRELEETARELARITGKPITEALLEGARRELTRQKEIKKITRKRTLWDEVQRIQQEFAALPSSGTLSDDEILGYDEHGIPTK